MGRMPEPTHRDPDGSPRRRLNVPGVLAIVDRRVPARRHPPTSARIVHRLVIGRGAGFGDAGGTIADWKRTAYLVERASLTSAMDVTLPEATLAEGEATALGEIARRAPLVEVDEDAYHVLVAAGARGHVVAGIRTASGYAYGAGAGSVIETSEDDWSPEGAHDRDDVVGHDTRFADRFLRAASAGAIDEHEVLLAARLRDAAEDEDDARSWAANLPPPPTSDDEATAREIVRAIESAGAEAETIAVPIYGTARRVRVPAERCTGRAGALDRIPGASLWYVENVAPERRPVHVARKNERRTERAPRPRPTPAPPPDAAVAPTGPRALAAVLLVALVLGLLWLLTR